MQLSEEATQNQSRLSEIFGQVNKGLSQNLMKSQEELNESVQSSQLAEPARKITKVF